jgi:hypothetical protein
VEEDGGGRCEDGLRRRRDARSGGRADDDAGERRTLAVRHGDNVRRRPDAWAKRRRADDDAGERTTTPAQR